MIMNDADKKRLSTAIATSMNLQADLTNMIGRGPRAAKFWAEQAKRTNFDAAQKKKLKDISAVTLKLVKDAKVVVKDLHTLHIESNKLYDKFGSGKEFRDKHVAKRLATSRALDQNATKMVLALKSVLGGGLWPGMREVDPKVVVDSLEEFSRRFGEMRIDLGRV
jgi:hypothetical protein